MAASCHYSWTFSPESKIYLWRGGSITLLHATLKRPVNQCSHTMFRVFNVLAQILSPSILSLLFIYLSDRCHYNELVFLHILKHCLHKDKHGGQIRDMIKLLLPRSVSMPSAGQQFSLKSVWDQAWPLPFFAIPLSFNLQLGPYIWTK